MLLLLAIPAPAAAGPCDRSGAAAAVACEVNQERAERGLARLGLDDRLTRAGEAHARDMVRRDYFSHVTPGGGTLEDRLRETGYAGGRTYWWAGETLAWGRGSRARPAAVVAAWMRSEDHRRVLLHARYRDIGVGVAEGDPLGGGGTTFAAELGARR